MTFEYEEDNSLSERIRRELRNPSMRKIFISIVVVIAVVSAPFAPGWISSTKSGINEVTADHDLQTSSRLPNDDLTDEQISPYLIEKAETMRDATGPFQWEIVNFRFGPCDPDALAAHSDGAFRTALTDSCTSLADIQGRYQRDCYIAASCNVSDEAKNGLNAVIAVLQKAQINAGY